MEKTLESILSDVIAAKEQAAPYGAVWYSLSRISRQLTEAIGYAKAEEQQEEERKAVRETLGKYGFSGPFTARTDGKWVAEVVAEMTPAEQSLLTDAYLRGEL